jgi:large subunit ribosomal protein LP0
MKKAIFEMQ